MAIYNIPVRKNILDTIPSLDQVSIFKAVLYQYLMNGKYSKKPTHLRAYLSNAVTECLVKALHWIMQTNINIFESGQSYAIPSNIAIK